MFAIDFQPVGLTIGNMRPSNIRAFVPINPQPLEIANELVFVTRFTPFEVSVLDAQDHSAALLAGEKPIKQSGTGVADVQLPGWRRSKTNTNTGSLILKIMLTGAEPKDSGPSKILRLGWEDRRDAFHPAILPAPPPADRCSVRAAILRARRLRCDSGALRHTWGRK